MLSGHLFLSPGGHRQLMVRGVLPNSSSLMPSTLLTEQTEEQSGAHPLTDDEDDDEDEEEIYQSSDEEEDEEVESLVTDVPEQTILASLMEGKTPHQKCDECSILKKESESTAAIAERMKIKFQHCLCLRTYPQKRKNYAKRKETK